MTSTQPNFNHIAKSYRWLEYLTLGRSLQNCREHYLTQLQDRRHALILGDGDGRFLVQLLRQNPQLQADAVDTSSTMLQLLSQRCAASAPRLQTHQADALTIPLEKTYDLVVTHFFLDCLTQTELNSLITRITPNLTPGALWLISDFRIPMGPMHLPARILVRSLYLAFCLLTGLRTTQLPDHATPLAQAGLTRTTRHHSLAGILTTELWQA